MSGASAYERKLAAEAMTSPQPPIERGTALVLAPDGFQCICDAAVWPALATAGYRPPRDRLAFDLYSWLHDAVRWISGADVIIADVTARNPQVLYVVGLCHGLGRQPILISQDPSDLPFMLRTLRYLSYSDNTDGLRKLREDLARAIRILADSAQLESGSPPTIE